MNQMEAIAHQKQIVDDGYDLSFWYGTGCTKCHEVFPKLQGGTTEHPGCWYECEVCGKKSELAPMPWVAREYWNAGRMQGVDQLTLFGEM